MMFAAILALSTVDQDANQQAQTAGLGPYDKFGRLAPVLHDGIDYNVERETGCCKTACGTSDLECQYGCGMWIHYSSLNWDSSLWWPKLEKKCSDSCNYHNTWNRDTHFRAEEARTANAADPFDREGYFVAKEEKYRVSNGLSGPVDEHACRNGCQHYLGCILDHNDAASLEESPSRGNDAASLEDEPMQSGGGGCPDGFTADPDDSGFCVADGICRMKDSYIPSIQLASCTHPIFPHMNGHCATLQECKAVCVDAGADCIGFTFAAGKCTVHMPWKKDPVSGDAIELTPTCVDRNDQTACPSDNAAIEAKRTLWNAWSPKTNYGMGLSTVSWNPSQQYFAGSNRVDMVAGAHLNSICYAKNT